MPALLPPLLLLLFGAWAGTFTGGAGWTQTVVGHGALLGVAVWGATRGDLRFDALGLGPAGRWLPPALYLAVLASWWASPVPRAGRVALVLLPAFWVLPGVVAAVWDGEAPRRRGLRGCSVVVIFVSLWALWDHLALGSPRAAAPLGHHNLLAVWLLAVLPPAVLPVREPTRWRVVGGLAGALGTAALVATRSLLGAAGGALLAVAALVSLRRSGSKRSSLLAGAVAVAGLAAVLAVGLGPRVAEMVAGRDPSARARAVYWQAGVAGARDRWLLGWGPGATPWVLGEHLRPVPGVNPPGEVVGQLHSQPLQLVYELGGTGLTLFLALLGVFARRRWRDAEVGAGGPAERREKTPPEHRKGARDPALTFAGLAGLGAAGVALLGTAALDVTAIPVALALSAGATLAGGTSHRVAPPRLDSRARRVGELACALSLAVALVVLVPVDAAHRRYDRSLALEGAAAARELAAATALDPRFPWYRAWSAWLGGTGALGRQAAAEPALEAARGAPGVAPLWLMAGVYGLEARSPHAGEALARACRLDPLSPLAPFYLAAGDPESPSAPRRAARALLAEPRLLAAVLFVSRPDLLAAALAEVEAWPGVPDGWKMALLEAAEHPPAPVERSTLSAELGAEAATSIALHVFRRRPRRLRLAPVTVSREGARAVTLPPATILPETGPRAFSGRGCEGF